MPWSKSRNRRVLRRVGSSADEAIEAIALRQTNVDDWLMLEAGSGAGDRAIDCDCGNEVIIGAARQLLSEGKEL
jgi:hypothetical protein